MENEKKNNLPKCKRKIKKEFLIIYRRQKLRFEEYMQVYNHTKNETGYTLAELLITVAIIGILVAITIPVFASQIEKRVGKGQ